METPCFSSGQMLGICVELTVKMADSPMKKTESKRCISLFCSFSELSTFLTLFRVSFLEATNYLLIIHVDA